MPVEPCWARFDKYLASDPWGRLVFNRAANCLCRNRGKHVNKRAGPPQARDAICTAVHQMEPPVIHCPVELEHIPRPWHNASPVHPKCCLYASSQSTILSVVALCQLCARGELVRDVSHPSPLPLAASPGCHAPGLTGVSPVSACKRKEEQPAAEQPPAPKKPRLVFTDLQRRTLQAIFKVSHGQKQPSARRCPCLAILPEWRSIFFIK